MSRVIAALSKRHIRAECAELRGAAGAPGGQQVFFGGADIFRGDGPVAVDQLGEVEGVAVIPVVLKLRRGSRELVRERPGIIETALDELVLSLACQPVELLRRGGVKLSRDRDTG